MTTQAPPLTLLIVLVIARAIPSVWWSGVHFDSDQAIVGLMAKHIAEGRAVPLYFYGQAYMLAVEAWLAAPLMLVLGPTVFALKFPLVLINVAIVWLVFRSATRAGLPSWLAFFAALPVALPPAGVSARLLEANGGNVEPLLYVLSIWVLRRSPWMLGGLVGVALVHREFAAYGVVALLLLELASGRLLAREGATRWAVVAICVLAARTAAATLLPLSSVLGPGTRGADHAQLSASNVEALASRLCFTPETWASRADALWKVHVPELFGAAPGPLSAFGVNTTVAQGHPVSLALLGALLLASVTAVLPAREAREDPRSETNAPFGVYLILVALISTAVYTFATCSDVSVYTLRYNLLALLLPVGLCVVATQRWRAHRARIVPVLLVAGWCSLNAWDVGRLTLEYATSHPPDRRQMLADVLVSSGVQSAWAEFRIAYHVTFLARERVRVSAIDFIRVQAYADEATAVSAPYVETRACAGGTPLGEPYYLCPASENTTASKR